MKKIIYLLALAIFAVACSKSFLEEDPKGQLTTEGFCKNKAELDMALTALYKALSTTNYSEEPTALFCGADDLTTRPGSNKEKLRDYDMFVQSKDQNEANVDCWLYYYDVVNCANFIINNYELATTETEEVRNNAAGQAYCLRAWAYFMITRLYKDVPLVTTNVADKNILKSPTADVYKLIVEDLQKAEVMLPDTWPDGTREHGVAVTKGTAKSVLASVYLHMAGYPINDASKYALAAQKAKEVLDNAGAYGYRLLDDYQELWLDNQFNDELIFGVFYDPSTESPNYRSPMMGQPEDEGGWDEYFCEINFFNSFPAGPRKDATFQTTMKLVSTGEIIPWQQCVQKHPYYKKMRYANGSNPDNVYDYYEDAYHWSYSSNRTAQVMRFAEVKLIYAEAQAMSANPDASAYKEINDVRYRAGLPDLTPGLSQMAFRDSVVAERAWEFAGPEQGQRWFDLVRLERVEQANSNRHPDELPLVNTPSKEYYFSSIPYSEKLINPNLGL
jgi:starch-binding outer membrane protein, SusD/RagB family